MKTPTFNAFGWLLKRRQRTAALQDRSDLLESPDARQRLGVRQSPAAFEKNSASSTTPRPYDRAFTLVEIMIAITILTLVLAAIYSSWTAILRSSKVGLDAAASVQRARVAIRTIEESLGSAQIFVRNTPYYAFMANNGSDATLSFVARLDKFFPRAGKFGDLDVRRVTFSVEAAPDSSKELVLRQQALLMDLDKDEQNHPLVLAKNVKDFQMQFWDNRLNDWNDEWTQTNALPRLIMITLKVSDRADATRADEVITRIVAIPSMPVQPGWQLPMNMGGVLPPGATNNPGGNPTLPGGNPTFPGGNPGFPGGKRPGIR